MKQKTISDKAIREYLGHCPSECRVRIKRDGNVERYGSPDLFDRSKDVWVFMGHRDDIAREMQLQH